MGFEGGDSCIFLRQTTVNEIQKSSDLRYPPSHLLRTKEKGFASKRFAEKIDLFL
jgi:hypothetical protein